jgi:hypothetical protein
MKLVRHSHALALRAALLEGDDALRAFAQWRQAVPFDEIDIHTQRLVPCIYRNVRSLGGDDPILDRMKGVYRHTWVSNRLRLAACEKLLGIFDGAGIPSVLLKGAAVLVRWTSDNGLRPMDDVDVLVRREQGRAALAHLLGAGYKTVAIRADRFTDREFRMAHAVALRDPAGMHIDLHWRALLNGRARDQDRAFWDLALPVPLADSTTHVLSPEDHLYHTCAHAASWNDGARIDWAADAAMILREVGNQFDWDRFVAHARRDGIDLPVRSFVALLRDLLNIPVPCTVDRQLSSFRPQLFGRLDLALRRRGRNVGDATAAYLAFQDYRRRNARLSRKSPVAAIAPFVRAHWQFDGVASALAYGVYAALNRPPQLRPLVANRRRRRLRARDLPEVGIGRLDFSLGDVWRHAFIAGWGLPETGGRWTVDHEAVLAMRIATPRPRDLPVGIKVSPFLTGKKLTVEVWANQHQVDLWHFFPGEPQWPWRGFLVDGKALGERDTMIEFTFVIRTPRSPLALGVGRDPRLLGVFVQSARFGYALREDAFERSFDFRSSSMDTELLWSGWSTPEPTGCWTDGSRAIVGLRLPKRPAGDISAAIEADVFAPMRDRSIAPITIRANGTRVADIDRSSHPTQHYRFSIPRAAIADDGKLALTIEVPDPIAPATLGLSADMRHIGLHLTKLTMSA